MPTLKVDNLLGNSVTFVDKVMTISEFDEVLIDGIPINARVANLGIIPQGGASINQVLSWSGASWTPATLDKHGVIISETTPSVPNEKNIWFKPSENKLFVLSGSYWVNIHKNDNLITYSPTQPAFPHEKLFWLNTTTFELHVQRTVSGVPSWVHTNQHVHSLINAITLRVDAVEAALPTKAPISHLSDFNNPHSVTKAQVGLGNVDNTSDLNKPISNATQSALDGKASLSHTHGKEDLSGVVKTINGIAPNILGNVYIENLGGGGNDAEFAKFKKRNYFGIRILES